MRGSWLLSVTLAVAAAEGALVLWHAPFHSGGGYCSEAWAAVEALRRGGVDARMIHHGDGLSRSFLEGLTPEERDLMLVASASVWQAARLAPKAIVRLFEKARLLGGSAAAD